MDIDNNDNGIVSAETGHVVSGAIALTPGSEPATTQKKG